MADTTIDRVKVSLPAPAASSTSRPSAEQPAPSPSPSETNRDRVEPRRPRADVCWPPPFHSALDGIAQIRPIRKSLRRFGGQDEE